MITHDKFLNEIEEEMLRASLARYSNRDTLMLSIGLMMGLRAQEILNLMPKDYCMVTNMLIIRTIKGGVLRSLPVPLALQSRLKAEIDKTHQAHETYIFSISYKRLWQIWDKYRLVKKNFHSLRHTFAIGLYRKSKDVKLVQRALGHKNLATTEVYLDFNYTIDQMKEFIA